MLEELTHDAVSRLIADIPNMPAAEKMALLECFAPGRVALGMGRGLARREYKGLRIDMAEARERFDEAAKMILKALDTGFAEGAKVPLGRQW
jgi:alkanesulfonate monooxygenase SsuD/methylene tetrahydromethanopterin reductase-like flavin-dependent oxidoreductase (luciferase family)